MTPRSTGATAADDRAAVVLVDGEHHPDAVRSALDDLVSRGWRPLHALYVGGSEKVAAAGAAPDLGVAVSWPDDPLAALPDLLARTRAGSVIDLSADPVMDDRRRNRFAAVSLAQGARYEACGTTYRPPRRTLAPHPSIAVIATGKRTGKTAVGGALSRHLRDRGQRTVVVAMGRGGPAQPVLVPADHELDVAALRAVAARGEHAASDFYEDAVTAGVATIGCRRVGEGPSGEVGHSNVPEGVAIAAALDVDVVVLEGSGAAIPPAAAHATALVVPATADPVDLHAMLPLRFLVADLVLVTQADAAGSAVGPVIEAIDAIVGSLPRAPVATVVTRFRATPLEDVAGARTVVATTAPPWAERAIRADVEAVGATVVATTHALSDRPRLRAELAAAPAFDVLLTELKAAAIDVAAEAAERRGARTVILDNRPEPVDVGASRPGAVGDLGAAFDELAELARRRADARTREEDGSA